MKGMGGGVTHTRGVLGALQMVPELHLEKLILPLPFAKAPHKVRQLAALASSAMSPWPSKAHYLLGDQGKAAFKRAIATGSFDAVFLNGADLLPLIELSENEQCIIISHNVESKIIEAQLAKLRAPSALKKRLELDIEKTRRMEVEGAREASAVIAISERDAEWYRKNAEGTRVLTLGGTFDYPFYRGNRPPASLPLKMGYLAKMSWWPNREGAEWFLSSILPELEPGKIEAHFFGPGSESYAGRHIAAHAHGYVEGLETIWREINIAICPILSGSGLNIKLAEALYNGVPVLATPRASEGLPPLEEPGLAIVPPEEWAAFLRSSAAVELAQKNIKKETSTLFAAEHQAKRIATILRSILKADPESK